MKTTKLSALLCAVLVSVPAVASAQDEKPAAPSDAVVEEARMHYTRGVELYNDGDYRLALIEFQRAYALSPNPKVLYNIGEVHYQLNEYAQAYRELTKYLEQMGTDLAPEKRAQIEKDLKTLRSRTAKVVLRFNSEDADIAVDDIPYGKVGNGAEILLDAGRRRITVTHTGRSPETRVVSLAGTDSIALDFLLREPSAPPAAQSPNYVWVGWVATGVLAAGSVTTGILALNAKSALDEDRKNYVPSSEQDGNQRLADRRDTLTTYGIVTDVLVGATIVAAGVSLYFTIKGSGRERPAPARAMMSPRGGGFALTF